MAFRGTKPDPTAIRKLKGNPGRRKMNDLEPIPRDVPLLPPAELGEDELAIWNYVLAIQAPGVLTALERDLLAEYCCAVVDLKTTRRILAESIASGIGRTVETERGWVKNPLVNIIRETSELVRKLAGELGFTPTSRTRMIAPGAHGKDKKETSALKAFLNKKAGGKKAASVQ